MNNLLAQGYYYDYALRLGSCLLMFDSCYIALVLGVIMYVIIIGDVVVVVVVVVIDCYFLILFLSKKYLRELLLLLFNKYVLIWYTDVFNSCTRYQNVF